MDGHRERFSTKYPGLPIPKHLQVEWDACDWNYPEDDFEEPEEPNDESSTG